MGLFSRLKIGFGLVRRSGSVLGAYPKLLLFPLVGGVSGVAFVVTLFGSLLLTNSLQDPGIALYGALFVAYLVETFVASFFTAGLVVATRTVFDGEDPSIRDALATAWRRKRLLLAWSVVAAVVGVIIRAIESEENFVAQILAGIFTVAWSVMTYFVIPVIVFRNPPLPELFSESARTFKDTWGESIGAMASIDIFSVLFALGGLGLGALTFILTGGTSIQLLATVLVGGSAFLFGLLIGETLSGVAKTALYVYATDRSAPEFFEDMDFTRLGGESSPATSGAGQI